MFFKKISYFISGVNVNASDEQQRTALHFSASKGYSQVVNLLLQVSFSYEIFNNLKVRFIDVFTSQIMH